MRRLFKVLDGANSHFIYWGCSAYLCGCGNIFKTNVSIFEAYNYSIINCKDCKKVHEFYEQEESNKSLRKVFCKKVHEFYEQEESNKSLRKVFKVKEKPTDITVKNFDAPEQLATPVSGIASYNYMMGIPIQSYPEESNKSLRKVFKINEPDRINGVIVETSSFDLTTEEISSILNKLIDCHNNVARFIGLLKDQITLKKVKP